MSFAQRLFSREQARRGEYPIRPECEEQEQAEGDPEQNSARTCLSAHGVGAEQQQRKKRDDARCRAGAAGPLPVRGVGKQPWSAHRSGSRSRAVSGRCHGVRRTAASSASRGLGGTASTGHGACVRQYRATGARSPENHRPRSPVPTTRRSSADRTASTSTAPGSPRTVYPDRVTPGLLAANARSRAAHNSSRAAARHSLNVSAPRVVRLPSPPPGSCQASTARSSAPRSLASDAAWCRAVKLPSDPLTPTTILWRTGCPPGSSCSGPPLKSGPRASSVSKPYELGVSHQGCVR